MKPDPEKISGISKYPIPKTIKELRSYIGLTNFLGTSSSTSQAKQNLCSTYKKESRKESNKQVKQESLLKI